MNHHLPLLPHPLQPPPPFLHVHPTPPSSSHFSIPHCLPPSLPFPNRPSNATRSIARCWSGASAKQLSNSALKAAQTQCASVCVCGRQTERWCMSFYAWVCCVSSCVSPSLFNFFVLCCFHIQVCVFECVPCVFLFVRSVYVWVWVRKGFLCVRVHT